MAAGPPHAALCHCRYRVAVGRATRRVWGRPPRMPRWPPGRAHEPAGARHSGRQPPTRCSAAAAARAAAASTAVARAAAHTAAAAAAAAPVAAAAAAAAVAAAVPAPAAAAAAAPVAAAAAAAADVYADAASAPPERLKASSHLSMRSASLPQHHLSGRHARQTRMRY
eukprot:355964-Chlamydomonas_euryale.AAC.5